MDERIKKGTKLYYARIMPTNGLYEVVDMKVRTIEENWFSCTDERTKHAYLFSNKHIGDTVFFDRKKAVDLANEAEKHGRKFSDEVYYEEF